MADIVSVRVPVLGFDDKISGLADVAHGILNLLLGILVELLGLVKLVVVSKSACFQHRAGVDLQPAARYQRLCR